MDKGKHEKSSGPQPLIKAMSIKDLHLITDIMEKIYGDEVNNLTMGELVARFPDLIAHFDSVTRQVGNRELSDEELVRLETWIEVNTVLRDVKKGGLAE